MNDIELETLKNYARIIKTFCKKQGDYCGDCPFIKDLSINGNCQLGSNEYVPQDWEV